MAITFLEQKKRQRYLLLIFALITVATLVLLWQGFLLKPKPLPPPAVLKPPEIKINFEILKNPILKELQPFKEIEPSKEKIGRENPFLPY